VVIDLSYPMNEIWLAEVDPERPTWEVLGKSETRAENLQRNWEQHVLSMARFEGNYNWLLARHMLVLAENQLDWGETRDALWTLQKISELSGVRDSVSWQRRLSCEAVAQARLGMTASALEALDQLRRHAREQTVPDETYLYRAEAALATPGSLEASLWDGLAEDQPDRLISLLRESSVRSALGPDLKKALAWTFVRAARAARHRDLDMDQVMAYCQAALDVDPHCIPAKQDQREWNRRAYGDALQNDPQQETLDPLVAWWPFDHSDRQQVRDLAAYGLHGRLQGKAGVIEDPNRGAVLTMAESGVVMLDPNVFHHISEKLTVSLWIKIDAFTDRWQPIMSGSINLNRMQTTDCLSFSLNGPKISKGNALGMPTGTRAVNDGKWHHIAGVYDGTMLYQYVDGVLDDKTRCRGLLSDADREPALRLGINEHGAKHWDGCIDDVRVYNTALDRAAIEALHEGRDPWAEDLR
jgi:hypothetical protein